MFIVHPYSKDIKGDGAIHYRDSFIDVMDEIKDWLLWCDQWDMCGIYM